MRLLVPAGVWEIFIPDLADGEKYKFEIRTRDGSLLQKSDPFGVRFEVPPLSASIVADISGYPWNDEAWMAARGERSGWIDRPMSTYEVHLGSWARVSEEGDRFLTYREMASRLVPYVKATGFTHIELLPVMDIRIRAPGISGARFLRADEPAGPPEDFKYFVDACHQAGLGVILDWVPGHFPKDEHGLAQFDGTALFDTQTRGRASIRLGHADLQYGRNEVSFLMSNALFWLEQYHVDGLRSMRWRRCVSGLFAPRGGFRIVSADAKTSRRSHSSGS